jgi:hypothetical protein
MRPVIKDVKQVNCKIEWRLMFGEVSKQIMKEKKNQFTSELSSVERAKRETARVAANSI